METTGKTCIWRQIKLMWVLGIALAGRDATNLMRQQLFENQAAGIQYDN
jgi:hypothetical protein